MFGAIWSLDFAFLAYLFAIVPVCKPGNVHKELSALGLLKNLRGVRECTFGMILSQIRMSKGTRHHLTTESR